MNQSTKKLDYIPGLDGIRALAALLVIFTHWPNNALSLKFGWIGVNIFFVLSGFLITRILLNSKSHDISTYLRTFFCKRALRIFPVYYLFVFTTFFVIFALYNFVPPLKTHELIAMGLNTFRHDWLAYLTYTINLKMNMAYFFKWPMYTHAILGHVWSLAVEEQFYIIFPFVVYFSSTSTLKKIVISIILICPLIRLCSALFIVNMVSNRFWLGEFIYTNPFCQADALATGALLALYPIKIKFPYLIFFIVSLLFITVGLTCFLFLRKAGYFLVAGSSLGFDFPAFWLDEKSPWLLFNIRSFYQYSLVNLLAFTLIAPAVGQKGIFPLIFESNTIAQFCL